MASTSKSTTAAKAATRRAAANRNKQQQEAALAALPKGTLFVVLYIQDHPPQTDRFHWGYYHHMNELGGTKYHIQDNSGVWRADHGTTAGVFKSIGLFVLIEVAKIPSSLQGQLDASMRSYDDKLDQIAGIRCRQWLMAVMSGMIAADIVHCSAGVDDLQQECLDFGNYFSAGCADNQQPRPIVKSKLCS